MPTAIAPGRTDAIRFVLGAVAWSLGFFGLLRLNWIEAHGILPFTGAQATVAAGLFGTPALPIEVTLACSGADAMALCLGAIVAYPVQWRRRLGGAAGGFVLILALNTMRIGTLGRAAASPAWFDTLHVYVWPAILTLAIAGYVLWWMRLADRRQTLAEKTSPSPSSPGRPLPTRRFLFLAATFLFIFSIASPLYLESTVVFALAGFIARAAAVMLGMVGIGSHAAANVLWTSRGGFLVTQECISTPLIPVYLAAVCAYSGSWRRLITGVLVAFPLFIALGIARLLVVALPDALVASPIFLVHAFYQLLLGAVVVFLAALWRHGSRRAMRHALFGAIAGVLFAYVLGPVFNRAVMYPTGTVIDDPQGAIAFLPAFQLGLYLALWVAAFIGVGWKRFLAGFALLELTQAAGLLVLHVLNTHSGLTAQVRDIRAWAVAGPLLIAAAVVNVSRTPR